MSKFSTPTTLRPKHSLRLLTKRRAWFDDDGEEESEAPPKPEATGTPPETQGGSKSETLLKQDRANELIGQARTSGHAKGREEALAELMQAAGVDNADALKELLAEAARKTEAEKTELQREAENRQRAEKSLADLQEQLRLEREERLNDHRSNALKLAASKVGALDAEDIVEWARRHQAEAYKGVLDSANLTVEAKVNEILTAVKQSKPHWFKAPGIGTPSLGSGEPGALNEKEQEQARRELGRSIISRF